MDPTSGEVEVGGVVTDVLLLRGMHTLRPYSYQVSECPEPCTKVSQVPHDYIEFGQGSLKKDPSSSLLSKERGNPVLDIPVSETRRSSAEREVYFFG